MKQLSFILLLIPYLVCSQNINGILYDDDSTVKGALIINLTKRDTTYTDIKGNFEIVATKNDSIMFRSLFHHPKKVKVIPSHFNEVVVFELKKRVNELGEVMIAGEKHKPFVPIEYGEALGFSIAEDMKKNPHLYMPESAYSGGINFGELAKLIGINKLFKKKKTAIKYMEYKQVDSLFSNSKIFNENLIFEDLKISKEHKHLFYQYCTSRKLNAELLSTPDNLVILDSIFKFSHDFLQNMKEADTLNNFDKK
ncbi:carboxypeptidase-like regulatory domain-containing protein [Seonamhaeicola maritimus]|uniref:Carboxypeptidase-like regulatory domain-containing protein n=1 Tax=Seonamhaeicola maritimus TaxID=2591822 RepID=A0A5C7GMB4_9FLAO|nr:carboxypeptidase-like regulatory domain-containing protein [Seonamhaeicola maritimus]TXG39483.1 carboxypeptidase-like regulatory domain-containing protein [Seonamhaeicola maritimus]